MSAVEYLIENLPQIDWNNPHYSQIREEAIKLLKTQIKKAYNVGYNSGENNLGTTGEDYLKRTKQ